MEIKQYVQENLPFVSNEPKVEVPLTMAESVGDEPTSLSPDQRRINVLVDAGGLTYAQAREAMTGIPDRPGWTFYQLARQQLQTKRVQQNGGDGRAA